MKIATILSLFLLFMTPANTEIVIINETEMDFYALEKVHVAENMKDNFLINTFHKYLIITIN